MRERKVDCFRKLDAFVCAILDSTCSRRELAMKRSNSNVARRRDASHFHLVARRSFSKSFASHSSGHQPRPLIRIKILFKLVKNTPKGNLSVRESKIRYLPFRRVRCVLIPPRRHTTDCGAEERARRQKYYSALRDCFTSSMQHPR